jgi:hypothetical protein
MLTLAEDKTYILLNPLRLHQCYHNIMQLPRTSFLLLFVLKLIKVQFLHKKVACNLPSNRFGMHFTVFPRAEIRFLYPE